MHSRSNSPAPTPDVDQQAWRRHLPAIILAIALIIGLLLRLQGIRWGLPSAAHPMFSYHPDEAPCLNGARLMALNGATPRDFVYGGTLYFRILSLFLLLGSDFQSVLGTYGPVGSEILLGRIGMTLVALVSIYLLYKIGTLLFNRRTGAIAALLLAVVPAHVVWAQRVRPDELAAFAALLLFYLAVKLYLSSDYRKRYLYVSALVAGLAVALRFPLLLFAAPAGLAFLGREINSGADWRRVATPIGFAVVWALLGYLLGSPQSLSGLPQLLAGMRIQWLYQSSPFPAAIGRGPGIYQYGWIMMVMAISYPVYLMAVVGAVLGIRKKDFGVILILSALLPYLLLTSFTSWVVVRYLLPVVPFMALLAAYAGDRWMGRRPRFAGLGIAAAVLWTATVSFAYTRMETGTNVRDVATQWVAEHIPAGSTVIKVIGYRDDFSSNIVFPRNLNVLVLSLTNGVEPARLFDDLRPMYVVIGSRYYDELKRLGDRYPANRARAFYHSLQKWHYVLEKRTAKPPKLFGLSLQPLFSSQDYRTPDPAIYVLRRAP